MELNNDLFDAMLGAATPATLAAVERLAVGHQDRCEALTTGPLAAQLHAPLTVLEWVRPEWRLAWVARHSTPGDDLAALLGLGPNSSERLVEYLTATDLDLPDHLVEFLARHAARLLRTDATLAPALSSVTFDDELADPLRAVLGEYLDEVAAAGAVRVDDLTYDLALAVIRTGTADRVLRQAALTVVIREASPLGLTSASAGRYRPEPVVVYALVDELIDVARASGGDDGGKATAKWIQLLLSAAVDRHSTLRFECARRLRAAAAGETDQVKELLDIAADRVGVSTVIGWPDHPSPASVTTRSLFAAASGTDVARLRRLAEDLSRVPPTAAAQDLNQVATHVGELIVANPAATAEVLALVVRSPSVIAVLEAAQAGQWFPAEVLAELTLTQRVLAAPVAAVLSALPPADLDEVVSLVVATPGWSRTAASVLMRLGRTEAATVFELSAQTLTAVLSNPVTSAPAAEMAACLAEAIGTDPRRWRLFDELVDRFDGTLGELVALLDLADADRSAA